jgi:hypothetical protein
MEYIGIAIIIGLAYGIGWFMDKLSNINIKNKDYE